MKRFLLFALLILAASCEKNKGEEIDWNDGKIRDGDGNVYTEIVIGNQTWLREDLRTTKLNDRETNLLKIAQGGANFSRDIASGKYEYSLDVALLPNICPQGYRVPGRADLQAISYTDLFSRAGAWWTETTENRSNTKGGYYLDYNQGDRFQLSWHDNTRMKQIRCIKEIDKKSYFSISGLFYIIQTNHQNGESTFSPYVSWTTVEPSQSIENLLITMNGTPLSTERFGDLYQTTPENNLNAGSLEGLNGTYTSSGVGPEGETLCMQMSIDNREYRKMGNLKVTSLTCANGVITASWEKVENASYVGLMICPKMGGDDFPAGYYRFNNVRRSDGMPGATSFSFDILRSIYRNYDVQVRVIAANGLLIHNMIFVEDDNVRTILKGGKEFVEGDYELN